MQSSSFERDLEDCDVSGAHDGGYKGTERLWLKGYSDRAIARLARADRKTVKRYLKAAEAAGVRREGGEEQLGDEVLGSIAEVLRPGRPGGHGPVWEGWSTSDRSWSNCSTMTSP